MASMTSAFSQQLPLNKSTAEISGDWFVPVRMLPTIFLISQLLLAGFATQSFGQSSDRQAPDHQVFSEAQRAADQLITMVSAQDLAVPRLSDPQIAYLFSVAFSPQLAIRSGINFENVVEISSLQEKSGKLIRAYLHSGIDESAASSQDQQAVNEQVGTNLLDFLDEIALAYDFSLLAGANIADFVAGDPNFQPTEAERSAIAQVQLRILNSVLACSTDTAIEIPWREERLAVINGTARNFARLFDKKTAQTIADDALQQASKESDKSISDSLKRFALLILQDSSR